MASLSVAAPAVTSCGTCGDLLEPDVVHGAHNRLYTIQVHAYNHWCAEYGRQGWLVTLDRLANGGEPCVASWYATARAFHEANLRRRTQERAGQDPFEGRTRQEWEALAERCGWNTRFCEASFRYPLPAPCRTPAVVHPEHSVILLCWEHRSLVTEQARAEVA